MIKYTRGQVIVLCDPQIVGHTGYPSYQDIAACASTLLLWTDVGATIPGSYLAALTDFTEMVSPLAVPVTLASSQASLLRLSSAV